MCRNYRIKPFSGHQCGIDPYRIFSNVSVSGTCFLSRIIIFSKCFFPLLIPLNHSVPLQELSSCKPSAHFLETQSGPTQSYFLSVLPQTAKLGWRRERCTSVKSFLSGHCT